MCSRFGVGRVGFALFPLLLSCALTQSCRSLSLSLSFAHTRNDARTLARSHALLPFVGNTTNDEFSTLTLCGFVSPASLRCRARLASLLLLFQITSPAARLDDFAIDLLFALLAPLYAHKNTRTARHRVGQVRRRGTLTQLSLAKSHTGKHVKNRTPTTR